MIRRLQKALRELDELEQLALLGGAGDHTWKLLSCARKAVGLAIVEEHEARGGGGHRRADPPTERARTAQEAPRGGGGRQRGARR